jgi:cytochrome c-type biogenesis protein CcmH/NrfF
MKEKHRKSTPCGHFNDAGAVFCATCGKKVVRGKIGKRSSPSYKKIALIIGLVFLAGISVQWARNYLGGDKSPSVPASPLNSTAAAPENAAQIIAVAKNFACACEGCGDLPLVQCDCDMPRGALEEKKFIREKLAEGNTVEQVIDLVEQQYGHRL